MLDILARLLARLITGRTIDQGQRVCAPALPRDEADQIRHNAWSAYRHPAPNLDDEILDFTYGRGEWM